MTDTVRCPRCHAAWDVSGPETARVVQNLIASHECLRDETTTTEEATE